jgi:LPXTG-motif cell wall-anchored protein
MRVVSEPRRTRWRSPILAGIDDVGDNWITWMGLTAALLAALFLFLRADGYRLIRVK